MATVTYFFGRGLAEHIRFLLAAVGEPFTNRCLSTAEELDELRARGDLAFNQLPLTELDGLKMVQVQRHYTLPNPNIINHLKAVLNAVLCGAGAVHGG